MARTDGAGMTYTFRIATFITCIALTAIGPTGPRQDRGGAAPLNSGTVAATYTSEEFELLEFARSRFAQSGLELPDIAVEFPTDDSRCYGYGGVYLPTELTVRICRPSESTMIHELAHAWVETTFNDSDRNAFLELRGLETWTGGEHWDQRGAEQAAEIITWALMDTDITVRWLETNDDGTTEETTRLFKVPNSNPDQLVAAYHELTGGVPQFRISEDARSTRTATETTSPEAQ